MSPLAYSTAYLAGVRRGYRLAGRSFPRRFLGVLLVAALLWGTGIALLWESLDIFARLSTGETAAIVTRSKLQSFCAVIACPGWPQPR